MARTTGTMTKAWGRLTATANFTANDTVLVNGEVYKFVATPAAAGDIDIGGDLETSLANLALAINGTGTPGATTYFAGTVSMPSVIATSNATTLTITARFAGSWGNDIEFREGVDGGTAFSITRIPSGGAGAFHTFLADLVGTKNQINSEVYQELDHVINAASGA